MKKQIKEAIKEAGFTKGTPVPAKFFYRLSQEIAGEDPEPINKFWGYVSQLATRDSFAQDCNWVIK